MVERQAEVRKGGLLPWLRPDAKSQVTFRYENGKPVAIDAVVLSTQHNPDIAYGDLREAVMELIVKHVLPAEWLHKDTQFHINPTGQFIIGGPVHHSLDVLAQPALLQNDRRIAMHGASLLSPWDECHRPLSPTQPWPEMAAPGPMRAT